jgi:ribosomal protein RSM22 (predicted rRNA methylase)
MLPDLAVAGELNITCLDEDDDALSCSQDNLSHRIPRNVHFNFAKELISHIIEDKASLAKYGRQNIIYSMGVADYLSEEDLKKFIASLYNQLAAGGKLIITHRNAEKTFAGILPDWFCDIKPFDRTHGQAAGLFHECGISKFSLATQTDNFAYIYYFIVTKDAN